MAKFTSLRDAWGIDALPKVLPNETVHWDQIQKEHELNLQSNDVFASIPGNLIEPKPKSDEVDVAEIADCVCLPAQAQECGCPEGFTLEDSESVSNLTDEGPTDEYQGPRVRARIVSSVSGVQRQSLQPRVEPVENESTEGVVEPTLNELPPMVERNSCCTDEINEYSKLFAPFHPDFHEAFEAAHGAEMRPFGQPPPLGTRVSSHGIDRADINTENFMQLARELVLSGCCSVKLSAAGDISIIPV